MIANIPTGSWIVLLAAAVSWYSTLGYAIRTARGKLRPSLASWGVWTATASIGTAAAWSAGSTVGVVISAATALRCGQVFIPAIGVEIRERQRAAKGQPPLIEAEPHTHSQRILDTTCLASCLLIGIVWQITNDPVLALVLSIVVDGVACLPTIWHGIAGQEDPLPFALGMVGPIIALLVVRERVLADYAWPLYELMVNILMLLPPVIVGWPGGRLRRGLRQAIPPALGVLYLGAATLVFTVIPPPGGEWAVLWGENPGAILLTTAATLIFAVAVLPATWAVAQGNAWASPVTWTAWAALGLVAFGSALKMNVGTAATVQTAVLGGSAILMAVAAGFAKVTRVAPEPTAPVAWQRYVDIACSIGAALAFVALLRSTPENAITLTIAVDFIAFIPTLIGAWRDPMDQPWWLYGGVCVSTAITILAGGKPEQLMDVAYILYVFIQTGILALTILLRQWAVDAAEERRNKEPPTVEILLPVLEPPYYVKANADDYMQTAYIDPTRRGADIR